MSVPDAIAAAAGLDLALVQGYAESLASAEMWPSDGEQVEPGHAAALLIAILAAPEVVIRAQSLAEVQDLARQRSRIPPRRPNLETQLRRRGEWDDAGKLKRWLTDDLTRELNEYAKEVMLEIEAEREAAR